MPAEYILGQKFEFAFQVRHLAGDLIDADELPTWTVYAEDSDEVVATGDCAKRDDANTTGYYVAIGDISSPPYSEGTSYSVRVEALVADIPTAAPVGRFLVVETDVVRQSDLASLVSDIAAAVWNYLTSAMTTTGSIGKKLADWVISGIIGFGFGPYKLSADQTELEVYRANDTDIPVTLYADETFTTVLDLTNANKVYFTVKEETDTALDAAGDSNAIIDAGAPLECVISTPKTSGIITIPLTKTHLAAPTPLVWYAFDLKVIWTSGDVQTIVVGRFRTKREVTRKATV